MKRGKKLTRNMKEALTSNGYDLENCKFVTEDNVAWMFVETTKVTNEETGEEEIREMNFWIEKPY